MSFGFSIVICCYNSAKRLPETLKHIAKLDIPPSVPCELIIVNNASTDNTEEVVHEEWGRYSSPVNLQVVFEKNPGLTEARKKGFGSARYEYILFCDDDNWLQKDYLAICYKILKDRPDIGVLGGYGEPVFEVDPPGWFHYFNEVKLIAIGPQASKSGPVKSKLVYGAGSVYKKTAYQLLQFEEYEFNLTGRQGKKFTSGEDYELCLATYLNGYEIWYEPKLRFKHFIPSSRLTREYAEKYLIESAECLLILNPYSIACRTGHKPSGLFSFYFHYIKNILHLAKKVLIHRINILKLGKTSDTGIANMLHLHHYKFMLKSSINNISPSRKIYQWANDLKVKFGEQVKKEQINSTLVAESV
ncbi:MAG: glycosyltransferase [Chitinophagaceae bacterium]|nr:glycosyltransferase [Chitinophagaceae bacterium]